SHAWTWKWSLTPAARPVTSVASVAPRVCTRTPSWYTRYALTATLSVAAVQARCAEVLEVAVAVSVDPGGQVGGVLSRTAMPDWVPVIAAFAVSVAVTDCVPEVRRMTAPGKVWTPASATWKV